MYLMFMSPIENINNRIFSKTKIPLTLSDVNKKRERRVYGYFWFFPNVLLLFIYKLQTLPLVGEIIEK